MLANEAESMKREFLRLRDELQKSRALEYSFKGVINRFEASFVSESKALHKRLYDTVKLLELWMNFHGLPFEEFCSKYGFAEDADVHAELAKKTEAANLNSTDIPKWSALFDVLESVLHVVRKNILQISTNGKIKLTFNPSDEDIASLKEKVDKVDALKKELMP